MFWLKSCPRCKGDLYENKDIYGRYVACFQCGHFLGEDEEFALRYSGRFGHIPPGRRRARAYSDAVGPGVKPGALARAA